MEFEIVVSATIELGGKFDAPDLKTAIEQAKLELRQSGVMSNFTITDCKLDEFNKLMAVD